MFKAVTKSSTTSRDITAVYSSAVDIADFIANGSPNGRVSGGGSAPWNTYPHLSKNNNDDDMDIEENVGITVEGETKVISVVVTGDGATHQLQLPDYELFDYEKISSGTVTFKYFFPTGHAAIGKWWHIGKDTRDYTASQPVQIVGEAWTQATVKFKSKGSSKRFLSIKDSNGVVTEQQGSVITTTGTFHLKDILVTGEISANETKSSTKPEGS